MLSHPISSLVLLCIAATNASTYNCYSSTQLKNSMNIALPGDEIVVHSGRFTGNFQGYNNGDPSNPITVRSANPNNKAIIDGRTWNAWTTVGIYVTGNYWVLQDLVVENANKGIVFDNSVGGSILNCEVHTTGKYLS